MPEGSRNRINEKLALSDKTRICVPNGRGCYRLQSQLSNFVTDSSGSREDKCCNFKRNSSCHRSLEDFHDYRISYPKLN